MTLGLLWIETRIMVIAALLCTSGSFTYKTANSPNTAGKWFSSMSRGKEAHSLGCYFSVQSLPGVRRLGLSLLTPLSITVVVLSLSHGSTLTSLVGSLGVLETPSQFPTEQFLLCLLLGFNVNKRALEESLG